MALIDTFKDAADTIFGVFDSLTHAAKYVAIVDDGFSAPSETEYDIKLILESFSQRDVQFLSFSHLLQPTDLKGLVRGKELPDLLTTNDVVRIEATGREFHVIAWSVDPAEAVYVIQLREV